MGDAVATEAARRAAETRLEKLTIFAILTMDWMCLR
jgi:hypothetical protein